MSMSRPISCNFPAKKFVDRQSKLNSKEINPEVKKEKMRPTPKRVSLSSVGSNLNCSLNDQGPEIIWDNHSPSPSRQQIKRLSEKASIEPLSNILNVAIKEQQPNKYQAPSTLMDMWMAEEKDATEMRKEKVNKTGEQNSRRRCKDSNNHKVLTRSRTKKVNGFKTELLQFMQSVTDVQGGKTSQKPNSLTSSSSAMIDDDFDFDDVLDNISEDQLQLSSLINDNQRHHPNSSHDNLVEIDDDINDDELNDILSLDDNNDNNRISTDFDDLSVIISDDDNDDLINAVVEYSDQLSATSKSQTPPNHSTPFRSQNSTNKASRTTPISGGLQPTPRRSPRFQTSELIKTNQSDVLTEDIYDDLDDDCFREMDEIEKNSQQPSSIAICSREEINRKRQLAQLKLKSKGKIK